MRAIIAMLLMLSTYAHAGCGNISDSDQRAYCEAKTNGQNCGNIRNDDLRATCSAQMSGQSCGNIKDSNLRNECDAITR
ncbi:hypothetical protein NM213_09280 [Pseudomonas lactis]|uniref:Lipoprotein n=1 Tax=Pseudomonas lactis TaxID=1615674 RepID=A0ABS9FNQ9_9PSED|nr:MULTISPECIES: hypothetical protein [Pseudomonas]MBI6977393.1 hypothetical protein [Pseudomonas lactis]MBR7214314.1 hypothetical protein [Pseudomonas sp. B2021]MCF5003758.1 hypothetical protein [Pseudomonas lactis]MCF5010321.1 hypothetical protein [Pseudomonas lactis]MCF5013482.1 hypothetical protein [Pseudomonas lactis]